MPGVSTTGVYQQVRRMTIPVANWTGAAVSGAAAYPGLNTTHGLTDGRIPTLPSWVAEQMDSFRAFVVFSKGGTYGGVEPYISFPSYSAAGTDRVQVLVSTALLDECYARVPNDTPSYLELRVLFKSPHSIEGRAADQGEGFPASPAGSLFALPRGTGSGGWVDNVYVDPVNGLDTNDGRSLVSAWQTMGRAQTYMELVGTFGRSLNINCAAAPDTAWTAGRSNFAPEGVRFVNGARLFITGNAPEPDAVVPILNHDKQITLTALATVNSPRDCDHLRMTPTNGELWQDTQAAGNVALTAADIGKTVHITDGNSVAYATVSGVNGQGAAVGNRWVEINVNHPLFAGGVPAWVGGNGTVWTILDPTDPQGSADPANAQVTSMAGSWRLMGITSHEGGDIQTVDTPLKQNCISHIRFTTGEVLIENCDRLAFPGCRFEVALKLNGIRDCHCIANAVSDNLADRYFPDSVWAKQGFDPVGAADSFGGMGFFVNCATSGGSPSSSSAFWANCRGIIAGLCATGPAAPNNGCVYTTNSQLLFSWCSVGPDAANLATMWSAGSGSGSGLAVMNARLTCQLHSSLGGMVRVADCCSWLERAVNLADDVPDPLVAATKLNPGAAAPSAGLIHAETGGSIEITLSSAAMVEGINSDDDGGYVAHVGEACRIVATGGHDANWYGDHGWLHMAGSSIGYMSGNRTFPVKANAIEAADVYVYNSILTSGPTDVWTKQGTINAKDTTPSPVIWVDYFGQFKLGSPANGAGLVTNGGLVAGASGDGNGISCGANGIVMVTNHGHAAIADFQVNNDTAIASNHPAIVLTYGGTIIHGGENVASYLESEGGANGAVYNGVLAAENYGYVPTGEAAAQAAHAWHNDFAPAGVLSGSEQLTTYRHI